MSEKKKSQTSSGRKPARTSPLLSPEELAAMKETLGERKRARAGNVDGTADVLAKIAEMGEPDRTLARRIHEIVMASAPALVPRTWYGMPAYALEGTVVCFFQSGMKFKSRYATLGFQQAARLDDGDMWPTSYAVNRLTPAVEKEIGMLVKRAVGNAAE